MVVKRYRSIADMPEPPLAATPLEGLRAACALSRVSRAFGHDLVALRGVRKSRSVSDAWDHRQEWEEAAMRRARYGPQADALSKHAT